MYSSENACTLSKMACTSTRLTGNIFRTFWLGSLKIMNKCSSNNLKIMVVSSYLVFNNVLNMLAQKHYLYTVHGKIF